MRGSVVVSDAATGRVVRTFDVTGGPETGDGASMGSGLFVPPGSYFVRATWGGLTAEASFTVTAADAASTDRDAGQSIELKLH